MYGDSVKVRLEFGLGCLSIKTGIIRLRKNSYVRVVLGSRHHLWIDDTLCDAVVSLRRVYEMVADRFIARECIRESVGRTVVIDFVQRVLDHFHRRTCDVIRYTEPSDYLAAASSRPLY